jgi:hypothetical protein
MNELNAWFGERRKTRVNANLRLHSSLGLIARGGEVSAHEAGSTRHFNRRLMYLSTIIMDDWYWYKIINDDKFTINTFSVQHVSIEQLTGVVTDLWS